MKATSLPRHTLAAIPAAVLLFAIASSVEAQSLANQSIEDRLNTLMKLVDAQQRKIQSLEAQVVDLEMAQRGRGLSDARVRMRAPSLSIDQRLARRLISSPGKLPAAPAARRTGAA
ncbi:hypothetical protein PPH41_44050, partial [Burkholderia gladioli]|nr:hypothetical protein [Burkholderia gladioli]